MRRKLEIDRSGERGSIPKRAVLFIILLASAAMVSFSALSIVQWVIDRNIARAVEDDLRDNIEVGEDTNEADLVNPPTDDPESDYWSFIKMPLVNVDFDQLLERNSDTVGWINLPATNINYPIVQTDNNSYYLNHAFDGSKTRAGWIFADYRNNMTSFDQNTIVYGHSRLDNTMFGSLKNALQKSWYTNKDNHVIRLSTPTENTMWQVFAVYKHAPESYYITPKFENEAGYEQFLKTISGRSIYDFGVTVSVNDRVLTLSTCANNIAQDRVVLHARLIKSRIR
ncbi:class B sortase [Christensenellaceae bacterium OttesenSCG-928-L17]|nr:class B sortase [Christensenellaceae bacterium OttesenSCG-928-L17]